MQERRHPGVAEREHPVDAYRLDKAEKAASSKRDCLGPLFSYIPRSHASLGHDREVHFPNLRRGAILTAREGISEVYE